MSNANWQNHLNHTHQIYGSNGSGNINVNHGQCLTNCGSAACGAPLGMSGLGKSLIGQTYSFPTYTIQNPNPLTAEEEKELQNLEEARKAETKQLKIKEFKRLPAALRQHVVNHIMWQRTVNVADTIEAPMTDRERDLSTRKGQYTSFQQLFGGLWPQHQHGLSSYIGSIHTGAIPTGMPFRMIAGITEDEIIDAHNEATIEEQLLGTEEENTVQSEQT